MRNAALIIILSFFMSCDRPECSSSNKILQQYPVASQEYKRELARLIETSNLDHLGFWFDRYVSNSDGDFMLVNVQGDSICAFAFLKVENWKGIENIRDKQGRGYGGAQLYGLKLHIVKEGANTKFIYDSLERIFD
jgi:hypothetical protein